MSMLVVTKGPVAIAGSTSSRCNNRGTKEPNAVAISIDPAIPSPTTKPRYGEISTNCIIANNPNNNPYKRPRIIPTRTSFKIIDKLLIFNKGLPGNLVADSLDGIIMNVFIY